MSLTIVNLSKVAGQIKRPFEMAHLATVGDLAISLYICQGQLEWHKHIDEDELFLVHEGLVLLETVRGVLTLHAEELAVVPKGISHRSGSVLRSSVVLIRPVVLPGRKNGHRRLYALDTDPPPEKVRLAQLGAAATATGKAMSVAQVEDFEVLLSAVSAAVWPAVAPDHGALLLAVRGAVDIETVTSASTVQRLTDGELTVVPGGLEYRLRAAEPALLLTLARML